MAEAERRVEKHLHDQVTILGGTTYKFTSPGRVGVPDRIVIIRGDVWFVEVKTLGGKLSPMQVRELKRLSKHECNVTVVYGTEGVDEFIQMRRGL